MVAPFACHYNAPEETTAIANAPATIDLADSYGNAAKIGRSWRSFLMSQQSNDDLARTLDGLGETKPKPAAPAPPPASKLSQIKIQQVPAKPAQSAGRPAQPGAARDRLSPSARRAQSTSNPTTKPMQMPRPVVPATQVEPQAAPSSAGIPGGKTPLDAPGKRLAGAAIEARPSVPARARRSAAKGSALARTMIPILLTCSASSWLRLCGVRFLWKSIDNPTSDVSPQIAWAIGAFGVILWALAAFVMSGVARQLREVAAIPAPAAAPKR